MELSLQGSSGVASTLLTATSSGDRTRGWPYPAEEQSQDALPGTLCFCLAHTCQVFWNLAAPVTEQACRSLVE
jgi:hypothetical protein